MSLIYIIFLRTCVITFTPLYFATNLKLIPFIRLKINCEFHIIITRIIVASIMRSCDKNVLDIISGQRYAIWANISKRLRHVTSLHCTLELKDISWRSRKSRYLAEDDHEREYLDDALTSPIILVYPRNRIVSVPYRPAGPLRRYVVYKLWGAQKVTACAVARRENPRGPAGGSACCPLVTRGN